MLILCTGAVLKSLPSASVSTSLPVYHDTIEYRPILLFSYIPVPTYVLQTCKNHPIFNFCRSFTQTTVSASCSLAKLPAIEKKHDQKCHKSLDIALERSRLTQSITLDIFLNSTLRVFNFYSAVVGSSEITALIAASVAA